MTQNALKGTPTFTSHYFNISDQSPSSSTSSTISTPEPSSSSSSTSSFAPTSTFAAPTATITQVTSTSGLSPGAIAGASIGGTLGLVIVLGFLWWVYRRWSGSKNSTGHGEAQETMAMAMEPNNNIAGSPEIDSRPIHEMPSVGATRPSEVERFELNGGQNDFRRGYGAS